MFLMDKTKVKEKKANQTQIKQTNKQIIFLLDKTKPRKINKRTDKAWLKKHTSDVIP